VSGVRAGKLFPLSLFLKPRGARSTGCRLDDFGTSPLFFMDNTQTVRGGIFLQACEKVPRWFRWISNPIPLKRV
jgi:hypothetical protein